MFLFKRIQVYLILFQRDSLRAHKGRPNFSEAPASSEKFGGSIIKLDLRHGKFNFHAAPNSYYEIDECRCVHG